MIRTANKDARYYVNNRDVFRGSNCFSERYGETYAVFSYGYHWPMFIWKDCQWYENKDKYSLSTSKQQSQLRPSVKNIKQLDLKVFEFGFGLGFGFEFRFEFGFVFG